MSKLSTYITEYRTIMRLAIPLLVGQFGNIAVAFADNIMVGHYSTDALASASFVNNIFNIALMACLGFTYGLTPLLGALFAKKDNAAIGTMLRRGVVVNMIFTITMTLLMVLLFFNIHRLGQPEHLLPIIRPYYITVLCGMVFMALFNVFAQWCYAIGRTGLPTWIILASNVINVIGNYALIYGNFGAPEMGLLGAGISTLFARFLCAAIIIAVFACSKFASPWRPTFMNPTVDRGEKRNVFRTGFPVAMQMAFETASFSGSAIMSGWLGAVPLAAYQIVVISGMLGFCIYYSLGAAMAIPVSHAAGRGDNEAMRRSAWAGYHLTLVAMSIACILFLTCGQHIMALFTKDQAVLALAVTLLVPMAIYQFGDATQITFANALRGTAKVMPMLYIAFVSYIIVGIPATYLMAFPAGMGLYGIVLSFSICLLLAAGLYLYFFLRATKKK